MKKLGLDIFWKVFQSTIFLFSLSYIDETLPTRVAESLNINIHPDVIDNFNHSVILFKY